MEKEKRELYVATVSPDDNMKSAIVSLKETGGNRYLLLKVNETDMNSIISEFTGVYYPQPLLYSLFAGCLEMLKIQMSRALIYKIENGRFYAYIYLKVDGALIRMDARTSDAVLMAMRMKAPILIYEDVLAAEALRQEGIKDVKTGVMLQPDTDEFLISDSIELLQKALDKAINMENYELAAQLQREIEKQQQQKNQAPQ
ncbi:MAG: bifunctional nuclease family protein [Prevotellaceae bacterium]|jgi:bifunctional DNase/RNase|nr:bifunctional nuclease family protein [Prevotellaceae bacterium]